VGPALNVAQETIIHAHPLSAVCGAAAYRSCVASLARLHRSGEECAPSRQSDIGMVRPWGPKALADNASAS